MKWAFFLGSATVGGGTYVIFEHATRAMELGEDVLSQKILLIGKNFIGIKKLKNYALKQ